MFVILAETPLTQVTDLDILESYACLIFQSLSKHEIVKLAPSQVRRLARGLNVANLLWQRTPRIGLEVPAPAKPEHFTGLIRESNPIRRWYLLDASHSFSELQNSTNKILRKYFQELCWRRQEEGSKTKRSRTLSRLLQGCQKNVKAYGNRTSLIVSGSINFRVLRKEVRLKESDIVFIQGFISDPPIPGWYASNANPDDPARRFRLWIEGFDEDGKEFGRFIHANGDQTVLDINTLVDQLEGASDDEIAGRARRRVPASIAKGRRFRKAYT